MKTVTCPTCGTADVEAFLPDSWDGTRWALAGHYIAANPGRGFCYRTSMAAEPEPIDLAFPEEWKARALTIETVLTSEQAATLSGLAADDARHDDPSPLAPDSELRTATGGDLQLDPPGVGGPTP
jgi:hypothetical protein